MPASSSNERRRQPCSRERARDAVNGARSATKTSTNVSSHHNHREKPRWVGLLRRLVQLSRAPDLSTRPLRTGVIGELRVQPQGKPTTGTRPWHSALPSWLMIGEDRSPRGCPTGDRGLHAPVPLVHARSAEDEHKARTGFAELFPAGAPAPGALLRRSRRCTDG